MFSSFPWARTFLSPFVPCDFIVVLYLSFSPQVMISLYLWYFTLPAQFLVFLCFTNSHSSLYRLASFSCLVFYHINAASIQSHFTQYKKSECIWRKSIYCINIIRSSQSAVHILYSLLLYSVDIVCKTGGFWVLQLWQSTFSEWVLFCSAILVELDAYKLLAIYYLYS